MRYFELRDVYVCVYMVGKQLRNSSALTTLLLLNSLLAPCGAGHWGNFTPDRSFAGSANRWWVPLQGCHGNKMEACARVTTVSDCLTWSGARWVSSVDDLTPWAVGKYVIITGVCTGGVGLQYFIICRLSHLGVTCKRIYVCAEDVVEWEWGRAEIVPHSNMSGLVNAAKEPQFNKYSKRYVYKVHLMKICSNIMLLHTDWFGFRQFYYLSKQNIFGHTLTYTPVEQCKNNKILSMKQNNLA